MIKFEEKLAYLPWFSGQSNPRLDPERDGLDENAEEIVCHVCETTLEWRTKEYAYCPGCNRHVRAATNDGAHMFARHIRIRVIK